jgi:hypothetical protein
MEEKSDCDKVKSEHRQEESKEKKENYREKKEGYKEESKEPWDQCVGSFPDSHYSNPPVLEEQVPEDLPKEENEERPAEDEWHCQACSNSPCLFLQYQDELERHGGYHVSQGNKQTEKVPHVPPHVSTATWSIGQGQS